MDDRLYNEIFSSYYAQQRGVAPIDVVYTNNSGLSTLNKLAPLKPVRYEPHKSQMLKPVNEPVGSVNLSYEDVVAKPADSDLRYSEMIYEEKERREEEEAEMRKMFFKEPRTMLGYHKLELLKQQTQDKIENIFKEEWKPEKRAAKLEDVLSSMEQSTETLEAVKDSIEQLANKGFEIPSEILQTISEYGNTIAQQQVAMESITGALDEEIMADAGTEEAEQLGNLAQSVVGVQPVGNPSKISQFRKAVDIETLKDMMRNKYARDILGRRPNADLPVGGGNGSGGMPLPPHLQAVATAAPSTSSQPSSIIGFIQSQTNQTPTADQIEAINEALFGDPYGGDTSYDSTY